MRKCSRSAPWRLQQRPCQRQSGIASGCPPWSWWSISDQQPDWVSMVVGNASSFNQSASSWRRRRRTMRTITTRRLMQGLDRKFAKEIWVSWNNEGKGKSASTYACACVRMCMEGECETQPRVGDVLKCQTVSRRLVGLVVWPSMVSWDRAVIGPSQSDKAHTDVTNSRFVSQSWSRMPSLWLSTTQVLALVALPRRSCTASPR